jgi:hypothetical protein
MQRSDLPTRTISWASATWPAAVPLLCAAHCLALPVLVLFAPALAPDPRIELAVLGGAATISVAVLAAGYRVHRRGEVWVPATLGIALWVIAHAAWLHGPGELALEAGGALLIAGSLIRGAWLRHLALCDGCGCPAHAEGRAEVEDCGCASCASSRTRRGRFAAPGRTLLARHAEARDDA